MRTYIYISFWKDNLNCFKVKLPRRKQGLHAKRRIRDEMPQYDHIRGISLTNNLTNFLK